MKNECTHNGQGLSIFITTESRIFQGETRWKMGETRMKRKEMPVDGRLKNARSEGKTRGNGNK